MFFVALFSVFVMDVLSFSRVQITYLVSDQFLNNVKIFVFQEIIFMSDSDLSKGSLKIFNSFSQKDILKENFSLVLFFIQTFQGFQKDIKISPFYITQRILKLKLFQVRHNFIYHVAHYSRQIVEMMNLVGLHRKLHFT